MFLLHNGAVMKSGGGRKTLPPPILSLCASLLREKNENNGETSVTLKLHVLRL